MEDPGPEPRNVGQENFFGRKIFRRLTSSLVATLPAAVVSRESEIVSHRHLRPTSRDIWTIVETPLAHARSYRKSKTHINRRKDSDFDVPGMIRPGSRERQRVGMRSLAHARS